MPKRYHSYLIVGGEGDDPQEGIASIITFGDPVPGLKTHHMSRNGGVDGAIELAEKHLDALHPDLKKKERAGPPSIPVLSGWVHAVFPQLLEGLAQEEHFLKNRNPTWRYRMGSCEFVRPLAEYMQHQQEPLLDQFLRQNPHIAETAESHDHQLSLVEAKATALHTALLCVDDFLALVNKVESEFPDWRGASPTEEGPSVLAECAVNWTHISSPQGTTHSAAWREHGPEVLNLCRAHSSTQQRFDELQSEIASLSGTSLVLQSSLTSLRTRLTEEFEVPPVSVEPYVPYRETF